ncbi:MAG: tetratricopeptide repeat protein, partial [Novosphingobium sp.]|nr:tetratricopeptide repeat protein [Novosphingobium sp.]
TLQRLERLGKLPSDGAILMGDAAIMRGQYDEALQRVEGMDSAEAWRVRGQAHVAMQKTEEAEEAFAKGVLAPGPKHHLLAVYGRLRLEQGDRQGARRMATQALAENPDELDALRVMGKLAEAQGDFREALATYDKTLKAYPDDPVALFGKIASLGELGRFKELEPALAKVDKLFPGNPQVTFYKAMLAAQAHDWGKVRKILQPMERNLDQFPDLQMLYAQALLELGQVEQARAYLSPLLLQAPDNRQVRLSLGKAQLAGKDPHGALDTLRIFADDPEASAEELALLARAAKAAGDPQEEVYAAQALAARNRHPASPGKSAATP